MLRYIKARSLLTLFAGNTGANSIYILCFLVLGASLDKENFGLFRVAYAYITIGSAIALLGLNSSITKHYPGLSTAQKKAIALIVTPLLIISSLGAGVFAYLTMPALNKEVIGNKGILYFLSFPVSICGAVLCHMSLAIMQGANQLGGYSKLQFIWRALLFGSAMAGGLIGGGVLGLVSMAGAYLLILPIIAEGLGLKILGAGNLPDYSALGRVFRSAVWPLASICVSTIYGSAEFLYIRPADISSGLAGSYSLASLLYVGGVAFFLPFQIYVVSKIVAREIDLKGVFRLQGVCFVLVVCTAAFGVSAAYLLSCFDPGKFDNHFFDFSALVAVKLALWGGYAVTGSIIYFVGKEFESFLLSSIAICLLVTAPYLMDIERTLRNIVCVQIVIGFLLLIGATYLFIDGYKYNYCQK